GTMQPRERARAPAVQRRTMLSNPAAPPGLVFRPKAQAVLARAGVQAKVKFPQSLGHRHALSAGGVVQRRMSLTPTDLSLNRISRRLALSARRLQWPRIIGEDVDQEQRIIAANLEAMIAGVES